MKERVAQKGAASACKYKYPRGPPVYFLSCPSPRLKPGNDCSSHGASPAPPARRRSCPALQCTHNFQSQRGLQPNQIKQPFIPTCATSAPSLMSFTAIALKSFENC